MQVAIIIAITAFAQLCLTAQADDRHHHNKRHHGAHEHGSAKMNLATEGSRLLIELEIPAHDIVGFEHKPENQKQRASLQTAVSTLKSVNSNLFFSKEAKCKPSGTVEVDSALLEEADHKDHRHKEEAAHAEFQVKYKLKCERAKKLKQVDVLLFKNFVRIKKLRVQAVTESGAVSKELSPKAHLLKLGN